MDYLAVFQESARVVSSIADCGSNVVSTAPNPAALSATSFVVGGVSLLPEAIRSFRSNEI